ncbi:MAG: tetratricopeptide repeat protein [Myxococcales bacterium]|nr:tetratricopeptide repeat protein [Myxococcales bacterium]MCB9546313.1 tetratricopeptide repeat protein [Myxococcales bacterium]
MITRVLLFLLVAVGATQAASDAELQKLHALVSDWQVAEARRRLEPLLAADPDAPSLAFVEGRLLFFEGRYQESLAALDRAIARTGDSTPPQVQEFRGIVATTYEKLKGFDEVVTPDGRFLLRFSGRDRLMIPYVQEVLQKADAAFSEDFRFKPEGRVVVEIYPDALYLAALSPLTEKDIETSGTIALCKYNRLMFTSPRALVRGYGWRDTVAHEFVHYYLTKASGNTVPIWLHEGIAKFMETRWRAAPGAPMEPPQEDLLARSLKEDKLVTFAQMHPSMAKLPSQEAASLAYAEVHTAVQLLWERKGYDGLMAFIGHLRDGADMDEALTRVYGVDLDGLWNTWKAEMKRKGLRTYPGLVQTSLKFKRPGEAEGAEGEDDYGTIEEKKVKDFAHLGELLRARDRHGAALLEYRKAMALGGEGNPVIQNGAASALIELGRFAEVPAALERVSLYYPGFLKTHLNLGQAFMQLGDKAKAIGAFEEAVGINPFHPLPHQALAALYADAGQPERAEQARASLEMLK